MVTIYWKLTDGGANRPFAWENDNFFLVVTKKGTRLVTKAPSGKLICGCEDDLKTGYCHHREMAEIVTQPKAGFTTTTEPYIYLFDSKSMVVWLMNHDVFCVKEGQCDCFTFRTTGTCKHLELARRAIQKS